MLVQNPVSVGCVPKTRKRTRRATFAHRIAHKGKFSPRGQAERAPKRLLETQWHTLEGQRIRSLPTRRLLRPQPLAGHRVRRASGAHADLDRHLPYGTSAWRM